MDITVFHSLLWCFWSSQSDKGIAEFQVLENFNSITLISSSSQALLIMSSRRKIYSSLGPAEVVVQPGLLHHCYVQLLSSNCWVILSHLLVSLLVIRLSSDLGTYKNFTLAVGNMKLNRSLKLIWNKAVRQWAIQTEQRKGFEKKV